MHPDDQRTYDAVKAALNRQGWGMLAGWLASVAVTLGTVLLTGIGPGPSFGLGVGLGVVLPAVGGWLATR